MFRLLGFDVRVRTGFIIFLVLIVAIYPGDFGLWLAGSLAGFTLLHELGHAVAARRAGAEASISLDFLAGYTSFKPTRPITRASRALISVAGPATQIGISCAVLAAMGVNPLSLDSVSETDASAAIWWAGPAIGALNLIPVLPLDGGHLAQTGLETFFKERAFRVMAIASLVITAGGGALLMVTGRGRFSIFLFFLLFNQVQLVQLSSPRRTASHPLVRSADAETAAWETGRPGMLEPGQRISPWYEAHRAVIVGDRAHAAAVIIEDLAPDNEPRWALPSAASAAQLRAIVDALPDELPVGNAYSARVLADVLLATGDARRAGEYAAAAFGQHRASPFAGTVARASASLGEFDNAVQWLGAATSTASTEPPNYAAALAVTMDRAPEFEAIRSRPEFQRLRASLVSPAG
ncbi:MAG: hypothetical protein QNJ12_16775 [Ilumatobacter sp.]|uniref:metalloprotease n=1 Tax=Ilumatobacter sp. TaxID=1967498 RepID=UPI00261416A0|nr:hypothetical protein [Ilumatobacter sp.]MDJ0770452.1 hypothetical protein [Ilumatobacter sp.]